MGLRRPLAGYLLGQVIPDIDRYFLIVVGLVILISTLPTLAHLIKEYDGPIAHHLAAERLGIGRSRRELASEPLTIAPEAGDMRVAQDPD